MTRRAAAPHPQGKALGERIRAARLRQGMTPSAVADLADVSRAYVHQLEAGQCPRPSAEVTYRIARTLGTNVGWLIGRAPDGPEPGAAPIPPELRQALLGLVGVTLGDVETLAWIHHRGAQRGAPMPTREGWRLLWAVLRFLEAPR